MNNNDNINIEISDGYPEAPKIGSLIQLGTYSDLPDYIHTSIYSAISARLKFKVIYFVRCKEIVAEIIKLLDKRAAEDNNIKFDNLNKTKNSLVLDTKMYVFSVNNTEEEEEEEEVHLIKVLNNDRVGWVCSQFDSDYKNKIANMKSILTAPKDLEDWINETNSN